MPLVGPSDRQRIRFLRLFLTSLFLAHGMDSARQRGMNSQQSIAGEVETKIHLIRGERVMLDRDLAELYQIPTKRLNEQVTRNIDRFPNDFMFPLSSHEVENLKSQFATSSWSWGGRRKLPRAFTEQGISMLSSVLSSPIAIQVNIAIMRTFVHMRRVQISNLDFETKLSALEAKYGLHDHKFKIVFNALRKLISEPPSKRVTGLAEKNE